ncbi:MAG: hypothetical protein EPO68_03155, partial [Planctomycetota bacterium]
TLDYLEVVDGGVDSGGAGASFFSIGIDLDLAALAGLDGAALGVEAYHVGGGNPSEGAGDYQSISGLSLTENRTQLAQIWYEQRLAGDALRVKLGKIDAFAEFASSATAGAFVNTSVSWSPVHASMPTYPETAFGALAWWQASEAWAFGLGVFDGAEQIGKTTGSLGPATLFGPPSDAYAIAEVQRSWSLGGTRAGSARVGCAHHTGDFARFDGGSDDGATIAYVVVDQVLMRECPELGDDAQGWSGFLMFGFADPDVSEVEQHVSLGATRLGWIDGRDADACGVGATWVGFSGEAGFGESSETAFEVFYEWSFAGWGTVKPDVQYVVNPGGDGAVEDALVVGARLSLVL